MKIKTLSSSRFRGIQREIQRAKPFVVVLDRSSARLKS